jgi:hypothetical protein
MCRVRKKEVQESCGLFEWDGDDLVVNYYPTHGEQRANIARENGKKGGRPRTQTKPSGFPLGIPGGNPEGTQSEPSENLKEKERKEKERKENAKYTRTHAHEAGQDQDTEAPTTAKAFGRPTQFDDLFANAPKIQPPGTAQVNEETRWRYEGHSWPWAQKLKRVGAKIGPKNWSAWERLKTDLWKDDIELMVKFVSAISADNRWPDHVEREYTKRRPDALAEARGQKVYIL